MNPRVAVIGKGRLADMVGRDISEYAEFVQMGDCQAKLSEKIDFAIVIQDLQSDSDISAVEEELSRKRIPWLRCVFSSLEAVVGPLTRYGKSGCYLCADNRMMTADSGRKTEPEHSASVSSFALRHTAHILVSETMKAVQGMASRMEEHLYIINLKTLESSLHFILPDPSCPVCGTLPDDSMEAARIMLQPIPKISTEHYRSRPLDDLKDALIHDYFNPRTGLFNAVDQDFASSFASVRVNLPSFMMGNEVTAGRSCSYHESKLTAILEGLERHCGQSPLGKRTVISDSFTNLSHPALDPVKTGLYSKEQYDHPDFPFDPFDPDLPFDWVWGYSFMQDRPILVPELLAYYSTGYGGAFVQEGSNGCAIGGSLEEAILYGILEVAERDSFLMTWYAKLPVPRLDPYSSKDAELRLMVDRLRRVAGYDIHLFNTTMENGVPSIWAVAKSILPGKMNLVCAAGAHLDPIRAAKSAIHEIAGMLPMLEEYFQAEHNKLQHMLREPDLVIRMEDHVLLYGLPEAEERLRFLLEGDRKPITFAEAFSLKTGNPTLTDDLKELVQKFLALNLDIVVVNQSTPETLRNGLHCVKVLIPGMLPITFGHRLTRLTGLERLFVIPSKLGYAKEPLSAKDLNPHPHPFS